MAMLDSIKRRAGWKRNRYVPHPPARQTNQLSLHYHSKQSKPADPHSRPLISTPIPKAPQPDSKPHNISHAHKQHYRIPYAVPRPIAAEQKSPSVRRRLTVYFKKDTQPTVSVTPIAMPDSPIYTTLETSRNHSTQPLSPAFSCKSMKSMSSQGSCAQLKRQSLHIKVPTRGKNVRMPDRRQSLKLGSGGKSFRRGSEDRLSVYTFLRQESMGSELRDRRSSRFNMDARYQSLNSPISPGVPV
jgi:hypothetical protein